MENVHGRVFTGNTEPTCLNIAYFSAAIGMTSQVADVGIADSAMRHLVLLHGLVSLEFNLMMPALTLNQVASALG